jgi:hypothetical protein
MKIKLIKIQRIRIIDINVFAIKVNNKYIIIDKKDYKRIFLAIDQIYIDISLKITNVKYKLKQEEDTKQKKILFEQYIKLLEQIGLDL